MIVNYHGVRKHVGSQIIAVGITPTYQSSNHVIKSPQRRGLFFIEISWEVKAAGMIFATLSKNWSKKVWNQHQVTMMHLKT